MTLPILLIKGIEDEIAEARKALGETPRPAPKAPPAVDLNATPGAYLRKGRYVGPARWATFQGRRLTKAQSDRLVEAAKAGVPLVDVDLDAPDSTVKAQALIRELTAAGKIRRIELPDAIQTEIRHFAKLTKDRIRRGRAVRGYDWKHTPPVWQAKLMDAAQSGGHEAVWKAADELTLLKVNVPALSDGVAKLARDELDARKEARSQHKAAKRDARKARERAEKAETLRKGRAAAFAQEEATRRVEAKKAQLAATLADLRARLDVVTSNLEAAQERETLREARRNRGDTVDVDTRMTKAAEFAARALRETDPDLREGWREKAAELRAGVAKAGPAHVEPPEEDNSWAASDLAHLLAGQGVLTGRIEPPPVLSSPQQPPPMRYIPGGVDDEIAGVTRWER